ncbi:MAG: hypothetical protein ACREFX_11680 [Opitutaceae bacterium]
MLITAVSDEFAQAAWRRLQADVVLPVPGGAGMRASRLEAVHNFLLRHGILARESFGYSHCWRDACWLAALGHPIAVNPGWRLRRHALRRGWPRVNLDSPKPVNL